MEDQEQPTQSEHPNSMVTYGDVYEQIAHEESGQSKEEPAEADTPQKEGEEEVEEQAAAAESTEPEKETPTEAEPEVDWQKRYTDLQSDYTRKSQLVKKFEGHDPDALIQKAQQFDELNQLAQQNPSIAKAVMDARQGADIPSEVANDPLFQYIQVLANQVNEASQTIQGMQRKEQEAALSARTDKILSDANSRFGTLFGREPNDTEKDQMMQAIHEEHILNGRAAADFVFSDKAMEHKINERVQAILKEQKGKGQITANSTVVGTKKTVQKSSGKMSLWDAVNSSWDELAGNEM